MIAVSRLITKKNISADSTRYELLNRPILKTIILAYYYIAKKSRKNRKPKPLNLRSRIVGLIMEKGPVKLGVTAKTLNASYQSLSPRVHERYRTSSETY
jgi:hypothetical protein